MAFFFRPKLVDSLKAYSREQLGADIAAGLTVGVVALPLAMAFAIASGLKPEAGLFTAIIAGFIISALGGSKVQIGGPAGAFIVIVYGILERYGLANLIIATAASGVLLFIMGLLKLGTLIRFIPVAVVIGFTNGIAVLIMLSQAKDFLGLKVSNMPADFFGILRALSDALPSFQPTSFALALGSLLLIVVWQRTFAARPSQTQASGLRRTLQVIPGSIVALVVATLVAQSLSLPVETIGSKFGGIPSALPSFVWPEFSLEALKNLSMPIFTITLLGAIESLLCARIADGLIGDRHNPNQELMAQGVANFVTPFFGGMPATGTIARTVTNVKSGGRSPVAGMVHALTLLVVVWVAAPLANHVPLAALAAILMFVAWNMGEWHAFSDLKQFRAPYRITLLAVFLLTVMVDLTVAVEFGLFAACVTFIYRISNLSRVEQLSPVDTQALIGQDGRISAYRFYGALFFGAVKLVEAIEDHLPQKAVILDLKNIIYIDSSGADALMALAQVCQKRQVRLLICGLNHQPMDIAKRTGLLDLVGKDCQPDWGTGLETALSSENL
ncbi:SulP family inorganic anion transporter [Limnohabitans sp. 103DPR2]|uniref:SulP family inorganic anion transporter n=1 Tax=Limnohabitans sp. 103DPR2 TaxID=1678129 RepID=UPI0006DC51F4|nr:SulP family inorganic anion transporter [Limnohabitans sp. 103DPR2]ALK91230.1 C4-dicarboxylic acid transporter DauA [Limnohabitans sp. 103DPR2]